MADENDIALAVMQIAAQQPDDIATFHRAKNEVPNLVAMSNRNASGSITRPGEPMWHQLLRNIQSHHDVEGNYIQLGYLQHVPRVGYRITRAGKAHLAALS